MIHKTYQCESKVLDEAEGIYELMPSTESIDRDGDVLVADGADLTNYRRNPVVMYAHDYSDLPVAKAIDIQSVPGVGLRAKIQFPPLGISPKADTVRGLWAARFLNAASVGFVPKQAEPNGTGQRFTQWEMLEFSIVPIPANADALRLAVKSMTTIEKRGRVLSGANEQRLREAIGMLQDVLDQLGGAPEPDMPADEEPATDSKDIEEVTSALAALVPVLKEYLK